MRVSTRNGDARGLAPLRDLDRLCRDAKLYQKNMPAGPTRFARGAIQAAIVAGLGAVTFLSLTYSGALQTGLTANPDEAAHYVTALMIRTYVTDALGASPLQFAKDYYLHYPKVAFGVWPPMFHLVLASWMFLTVASPASALVLVAITSTLLAYVIFRTMHARFGLALALTSAVWFVMLPTVQRTDLVCLTRRGLHTLHTVRRGRIWSISRFSALARRDALRHLSQCRHADQEQRGRVGLPAADRDCDESPMVHLQALVTVERATARVRDLSSLVRVLVANDHVCSRNGR